MKRLPVLAATLLLLFAAFSGYVKYRASDKIELAYEEDDAFGAFTRPTLDGSTVRLDSLVRENKFVWVTFWASWCGPCRVEMSMLAEHYDEYHDQGFSVVAVNVREDRETVRSFLEENPQPYPVVLDPQGTLTDSIGVRALPTSFLLDGQGRVEASGRGVKRNWFDIYVRDALE